jgi:hypothetical protein
MPVCQAITKRGTQCTRSAQDEYCLQHGGGEKRKHAPTSRKVKKYTKYDSDDDEDEDGMDDVDKHGNLKGFIDYSDDSQQQQQEQQQEQESEGQEDEDMEVVQQPSKRREIIKVQRIANRMAVPSKSSSSSSSSSKAWSQPAFKRRSSDQQNEQMSDASEQDGQIGEDEYKVEEIVNHRVGSKGGLYLVKWENYSHEHDTWLPQKDLKHLAIFQKYKRDEPSKDKSNNEDISYIKKLMGKEYFDLEGKILGIGDQYKQKIIFSECLTQNGVKNNVKELSMGYVCQQDQCICSLCTQLPTHYSIGIGLLSPSCALRVKSIKSFAKCLFEKGSFNSCLETYGDVIDAHHKHGEKWGV